MTSIRRLHQRHADLVGVSLEPCLPRLVLDSADGRIGLAQLRTRYDALLEGYETGVKASELRALFATIRG